MRELSEDLHRSRLGLSRFLLPVLSLLSLLFCLGLSAQTLDLDKDRPHIVSLEGSWRFHAGDDPRWADPGFDDSQWALQPSDAPLPRPFDSSPGWFRIHLAQPAAADRDLSFLFSDLGAWNYAIYADGRLLGRCGDASSRRRSFCPAAAFSIPRQSSSGSRSIVMALRSGIAPYWRGQGSYAGSTSVVHEKLNAAINELKVSNLQDEFYMLLASLGCVVSFVLFLSKPKEREYLWFSIVLLQEAMAYGWNLANSFFQLPWLWNPGSFAADLQWPVYVTFFFFLLHGRRTLWFQIAFVCAAIHPVTDVLWYTVASVHPAALHFIQRTIMWSARSFVPLDELV